MKYYQIIGFRNDELVYRSRLISNFSRMILLKLEMLDDFPEITFAHFSL